MRRAASILGLSVLALVAAALASGCAAGSEEPEDASGGAAPMAGNGGGGAAGGMGGAGGESLCEQDCRQITAPTCHVSVCNDGSHPGTIGQCVVVPDADGTTCDDGMFCTTDDSCVAGTCTGGPPNDCGMTPGECEGVACDERTKSCFVEAAAEGAPCTGSDLCMIGATCQSGVCSGGTFNDCFFAPAPLCHDAVCNPINGMCEPVPGDEGETCADPNDPCTVDKTCSAGQCIGGAPKDCSNLTVGCDMGVCDTTTGQCTTTTVPDGQLCDDLDACTTGETCNANVCGMGTPVTACSQTGDGCCPSSCDATNDYDCACPGTFVNGTCVYLTSPSTSYTLTQAQAQCQALGTGWGLCSPTILCDPQTFSYLGTSGCDCSGGASSCNCTGINVYVHVNATSSPYYIRAPEIANCGSPACTNSVSASCGVALCCKP